MKQEYSDAIILLLLNSHILTSNDLANKLSISKRSVKNYIQLAKETCENKGLELIGKTQVGYYIDGPESKKQELQESLSLKNTGTFSNNNLRFYVALGYILNNKNNTRMKDLEYLLLLPRSSINILVTKIEKWLEVYEIHIIRDRSGILLSPGEKRRRLAISHWYIESQNCISYVTSIYKNIDLSRLNNQLFVFDSIQTTNLIKIINSFSDYFGVEFQKEDVDNLLVIIKTSLYRFIQGYKVKLPDNKISTINNKESALVLDFIKETIFKQTGIKIDNNEAFYYYYRALFCVSYRKNLKNNINFRDVQINEHIPYECVDYLSSVTKLSVVKIQELVSSFSDLIKSNIMFTIYNNNPGGNDYYAYFASQFSFVSVISKNLCNIAEKYHEIGYTNKLLSDTCFLVNSFLYSMHKKLNVLFVHNCNHYELEYVKRQLNLYNGMINVKKYINYSRLDDKLQDIKKYDIVLSTISFSCDIPMLLISKKGHIQEQDKLFTLIHYYYEKVNALSILSDSLSKEFDVLYSDKKL